MVVILLEGPCFNRFDQFDKTHLDLTIKPLMRLIPNGLVGEEEAYTMWNVYAGLKLYAFLVKDKIGDRLKPIARTTFHGRMDETASPTWDTLEWAQIFHATKLISNATFALNEATRGVKHMLNHNEVPIWVTLAMQVLSRRKGCVRNQSDTCGAVQGVSRYCSQVLCGFWTH
jgi:hypothetical protein